jgi:Na+/melibiose symporter-like transporter
MKWTNKTFNSYYPPKGMTRLYEVTSFFRDSLFEFMSLFMLLYVQLASPISGSKPADYQVMFFTITISMVVIKIIAAFAWTFSAHFLENGNYPLGRYRTFMVMGLWIYTVIFLLIFFVAPLLAGWAYVALFILLYCLLECAYSINDIGYWSFVTTLTPDESRRGEITSWMNVFLIIGDYLVAALAPALTANNPKQNMTYLATAIIVTNFISQMILAFVMEEREEKPDLTPKKKEHLFDSFNLLFKDKQLALTTLIMFMIFLAQFCMIGNSANYFYYEYGYGSFGATGYQGANASGGVVSFIFTLCFGGGYLLSQMTAPWVAKHFTKKKVLLICCSVLAALYLVLFFWGFQAGNEILLYITAFVLAFFYGQVYSVILINCFDGVEYYQYTYGERKDGSIQSLKAFGVLTANAVQTGVFYLFLWMSGLVDINSSVAQAEAVKASGEKTYPSAQAFYDDVNNNIIHASDISANLKIFESGLTLLPLVLTVVAGILTVLFVKVNDEKTFKHMTDTIAEREKAKASQQ